jgi:hypothetical protein
MRGAHADLIDRQRDILDLPLNECDRIRESILLDNLDRLVVDRSASKEKESTDRGGDEHQIEEIITTHMNADPKALRSTTIRCRRPSSHRPSQRTYRGYQYRNRHRGRSCPGVEPEII